MGNDLFRERGSGYMRRGVEYEGNLTAHPFVTSVKFPLKYTLYLFKHIFLTLAQSFIPWEHDGMKENYEVCEKLELLLHSKYWPF